MNVGLVAAAGKSERMREPKSKQYLLLEGKPVLAYSLEAFCECTAVDELILVVNQEDIEFCKNQIVDKYRLAKVKKIIAGGQRRQDSVSNGLEALPHGAEVVVVHDGARPFIAPSMIRKAILALSGWDGVIIGVPVIDTVKLVDEQEKIGKTVSREGLWCAQTPQVFRADTLVKAHRQAKADKFYGTDDASLVERLGYRVRVVRGSYKNIKITIPEDLALAGTILESRKDKERR